MVAIADWQKKERERMLTLAVRQDWVFNAHEWAVQNGCKEPVVLLVARDALATLPFEIGGSTDQGIGDIQRKAGCGTFAIGCVSFNEFIRAIRSQERRAEMHDIRREGGMFVVCVTRSGQMVATVMEITGGSN